MKVERASMITTITLLLAAVCWKLPSVQAYAPRPPAALSSTPFPSRVLGLSTSFQRRILAQSNGHLTTFDGRLASRPSCVYSSKSVRQNAETALTAAAAAVNGDSSQSHSKPLNPFLSASLLIALDVTFRKLFRALAISFPSSLAGCCLLFATMLTLPVGPNLFRLLSPGATLLAKWLPVFFVPSLITLPLVGSIGSSTEFFKVLAVIVSGFFFTLLTTAGSVVGIRKLLTPPKTEVGMTDNVDDDNKASVKKPPTPTLPFSATLLYQFRIVMAATGVFAILGPRSATSYVSNGPLLSIFFLATTLHNFCWGARLDKKITKIVHPLVTCTALTWALAATLAKLTGRTFQSMLQGYKVGALYPFQKAGAGDLLLFLLGPAVVSLAISMYDRRRLMKDNWKEVLTGVGISSIGGIFGTAAMVRALRLASPTLRLSLLSRNITSPLAMAIASILGADVGLAVAMVVVTGLIGANFGASILNTFGIQDAVARGMGIGAAAHGLGTAAFVNEKDAFPFAAISMALTATACTCLVSVPIIKRTVIQLALGI